MLMEDLIALNSLFKPLPILCYCKWFGKLEIPAGEEMVIMLMNELGG